VFATSILVDKGVFAGLTIYNLPDGEFLALRAKAFLFASGGLGTLYGFTTYSQTVTGDGQRSHTGLGFQLKTRNLFSFIPPDLFRLEF